ncbi:hypothetical protein [Caldimonas brevitalea]|uniref:Uncharacterized protein n=1 Tax=Caldimonas brevitalea TaxID=413882 RepID=A0A0G3BMM1_9BURK|nr:hypothetical protein [Caldimonas brevitalea]AKJ30667.1 hypothetical protein AAW51_3976 [Caldimonas brevitalea]
MNTFNTSHTDLSRCDAFLSEVNRIARQHGMRPLGAVYTQDPLLGLHVRVVADFASQPGDSDWTRIDRRVPAVIPAVDGYLAVYWISVWCELCETIRSDRWFDVDKVAGCLLWLSPLADRAGALRKVLRMALAAFEADPQDYDDRPPVQVRGENMKQARL